MPVHEQAGQKVQIHGQNLLQCVIRHRDRSKRWSTQIMQTNNHGGLRVGEERETDPRASKIQIKSNRIIKAATNPQVAFMSGSDMQKISPKSHGTSNNGPSIPGSRRRNSHTQLEQASQPSRKLTNLVMSSTPPPQSKQLGQVKHSRT